MVFRRSMASEVPASWASVFFACSLQAMASASRAEKGPGEKRVIERALSGPRQDGRVRPGQQPDSARVTVFNLDALAPAGEIQTRQSYLGRRIKFCLRQ